MRKIFNKGDKVTLKLPSNGTWLFKDGDILTINTWQCAKHPGAIPTVTVEEYLDRHPHHQIPADIFELVPEKNFDFVAPEYTGRAERKRNIYEALEIMEHHDIRRVQNGAGECGYFIGEACQGATRYNSIEDLVDFLVPDNTQAIQNMKAEIESLQVYLDNKYSVMKELSAKAQTGASRIGVLQNKLDNMIHANK